MNSVLAPLNPSNRDLSLVRASLDDEHRQLVEILRVVEQASRSESGPAGILGALNQLAVYAQLHVSEEEALMQDAQFPDSPRHCAEHRKLMLELNQLQRDQLKGLPLQGVRLEQFLQLWLVNHVLLFDAEVAAHLRLTRQDRTGSRG